jgi:hypothetical protein
MANVPNSKPNFLESLIQQLYGSQASQDAIKGMVPDGGSLDEVMAAQATFSNNPFNVQPATVAGQKTSALGNTAKLLGANIKAHPWITAGTALNAGGNLAGLFDNDKMLGQILGTAAGAIVPSALGMGLSPLAAANVAMGTGNLGALFDTLRSKSEQEQAAQLPAKYTTY